MARPPFEEPVLSTRPPQEEDLPGGKVIPGANPFSNPLMEGDKPPESHSRLGILPKVLMAMGLAGGMLGIGAFVGVVVIWMSRIELTSRVPPTGTPVDSASPGISPAVGASPGGATSGSKGSGSGGVHSHMSSLAPALGESVGAENRDRTQVLLQMEIVQLDQPRAEQLRGRSAGGTLSHSAAAILEAMLHTQRPDSSDENNAPVSSGDSVLSADRQSRAESILKGNGESSAGAKETRTPLPSSVSEGSDSPLGPADRTSSGPTSEKELLRGAKSTRAFRERWGITSDRLLPSSDSEKRPSSGASPLEGSSSTQDHPDDLPTGPEDAPCPSDCPKEAPSSSIRVPFSSPSPGPPRGSSGDSSAFLAEISARSMETGLEELQRQGMVKRLGSAQAAILHRWPTQIELLAAASGKPSVGSSASSGDRGTFCSGKLHCLVELEAEDRVRMELVGQWSAAELSSSSERPSANCPAGDAGANRNERTLWYLFPKQSGPVGKWWVLASAPSPKQPRSASSFLCVLVRAEVQKPPAALAQLPLSESEFRERSAAQCRYLESLLRVRFPHSRIQLSWAAGKIFLHGQTSDWRQMEEILALVRRRAVEQWKIHDLHAAQSLMATGSDNGEAAMVNMLQVAQVRLRVQLVELDPHSELLLDSGKPERAGASSGGGVSAETRSWLQSLADAARRRQAVVAPAPSSFQWEELTARKLARILCCPQLVIANGQKETLRLRALQAAATAEDRSTPSSTPGRGQEETAKSSSPSTHRGLEGSQEWKKPDLSKQSDCGDMAEWVVDILPELAEGGRFRLEVIPVCQQSVPTTPTSAPSGVLSQTCSWHIQALLQAKQVLVIPVGVQETGPSTDTPLLPKKPTQVLVVWPESVNPDALVGEADSARSSADTSSEENHTRLARSEVPSQGQATRSVRKAEKANYEETFSPEPLPYVSGGSSVGTARSGSAEDLAKAVDPQQRLHLLEEVLVPLFPHSQIRLRWEAGRLIVEGQAANPAEASQILAVVRAEALPRDQSSRVAVVNRLRVRAAGPVQYVLRVRFVSVDARALRRAAEKVKRDAPSLIPLAGALLDLAERGGHLALDPPNTEQLPDLLRQAENWELLRLIAQPTFGILPGQPAEYLLPLAVRSTEATTSRRPSQEPPTTGGYLLWRVTPRWTEQARWQMEMILEWGGQASPEGKEPRSRLLAELEPGQTSAAAIPPEFWSGPGRLVVLTTPEIRPVPPEAALQSASRPAEPSAKASVPAQTFPQEHSPGRNVSPRAQDVSSAGSSSSSKASERNVSPAPALPGPAGSLPGSRNPISGSNGSPDSMKSAGHAPLVNPAAVPSGLSSPPYSSGSPLPQSAPQTGSKSAAHGLLPKLGQLFRAKGEQKSSSSPGYTLAESPDSSDPKALDIHVPTAPEPDSSRSAVIPRVLRPGATR